MSDWELRIENWELRIENVKPIHYSLVTDH